MGLSLSSLFFHFLFFLVPVPHCFITMALYTLLSGMQIYFVTKVTRVTRRTFSDSFADTPHPAPFFHFDSLKAYVDISISFVYICFLHSLPKI